MGELCQGQRGAIAVPELPVVGFSKDLSHRVREARRVNSSCVSAVWGVRRVAAQPTRLVWFVVRVKHAWKGNGEGALECGKDLS